MITLKHAYVKLTYLDTENLKEALRGNQIIRAWMAVEKLEKAIEEIQKPVYQAMNKKQKKQLVNGWMPDTDDGEYIEVKFDGYMDDKK